MSIPACPRLSMRQRLSCWQRWHPRLPMGCDGHPTCDAFRFGGSSSMRRGVGVRPGCDAPRMATWNGGRAGGRVLLAGSHCKEACAADTTCPGAYAGEESLHVKGRCRCAGPPALARTPSRGVRASGNGNRRRACSGLVGQGRATGPGRRARGVGCRVGVACGIGKYCHENDYMRECHDNPSLAWAGWGRASRIAAPAPMPPQFPESA